jgi:hypothetical protein
MLKILQKPSWMGGGGLAAFDEVLQMEEKASPERIALREVALAMRPAGVLKRDPSTAIR